MIRTTAFAAVTAALVAAPLGAQDLIQVANDQGKFRNLLDVIEAAGMTETLQGEGPYTLFAPTDVEAFSEIDEGGELDELLMNTDKVTAVLNHHLVEGKVMSSDLTDGMTLTTLNGDELVVHTDGETKVDDATILTPDIEASNGVIHAIDTVLMPAD